MTNQEIFDKVVSHLRKQGRKASPLNKAEEWEAVNMSEYHRKWLKAESTENGCFYRGPQGTKCAAGALMTDEEYKPEYEGKALACIPKFHNLTKDERCFISKLQGIHDCYAVEQWEKQFRRVAQQYRLVYSPPANRKM